MFTLDRLGWDLFRPSLYFLFLNGGLDGPHLRFASFDWYWDRAKRTFFILAFFEQPLDPREKAIARASFLSECGSAKDTGQIPGGSFFFTGGANNRPGT